jgi:hypothetical protein
MSEEPFGKLGWAIVVVTIGERVGVGGWRWMWVGARKRGPDEEGCEDGWRAEGEAQDVGDHAVLVGALEGDVVARYEVVGVHGGRGVFEDVVQASAGEWEGFGRREKVDVI